MVFLSPSWVAIDRLQLSSETLLSLSNQLSTLDFNEILLTGDLNWDWLFLSLTVLNLCVILLI